MAITKEITEYTGVVPKRSQPEAEFETNVPAFLDYMDALSTDINTWTGQVNTTQDAINTSESNVNGDAITAAQSASDAEGSATTATEQAAIAVAAVASLPEGTINDAVTAPDKAWSSQKIDQELSLKQDALVSGSNIKTLNGVSLLGSGDLSLPKVSQNVYSISEGLAYSYTSSVGSTSYVRACRMSDSSFLVVYTKSDNLTYCRVGNISGTVISYTAEQELTSFGSTGCQAGQLVKSDYKADTYYYVNYARISRITATSAGAVVESSSSHSNFENVLNVRSGYGFLVREMNETTLILVGANGSSLAPQLTKVTLDASGDFLSESSVVYYYAGSTSIDSTGIQALLPVDGNPDLLRIVSTYSGDTISAIFSTVDTSPATPSFSTTNATFSGYSNDNSNIGIRTVPESNKLLMHDTEGVGAPVSQYIINPDKVVYDTGDLPVATGLNLSDRGISAIVGGIQPLSEYLALKVFPYRGTATSASNRKFYFCLYDKESNPVSDVYLSQNYDYTLQPQITDVSESFFQWLPMSDGLVVQLYKGDSTNLYGAVINYEEV